MGGLFLWETHMATPIEAYIRQAAQARGINPDIAVAVAKSEGGLNDPYRQAEAILSYGREQSYGPFQLHLPKGLGKEALAAGVDPRKDWQGGVDFALDAAKRGGWGPWFGAKKIGITGMEGINGRGGGPSVPALPGKVGGDSMVARDHDPQVAGQMNAPVFGSMSPIGGMQPPAGPPANVSQYAFGDEDKKKNRLQLAGEHFTDAMSEVKPPRIAAMPSPSGDVANGLTKIMQNPSALAQMLLRKRMA